MSSIKNSHHISSIASPTDFPKLRIKAFAPIQERETVEAKFWKSFQITKEEKLLGAPNCIHFSPNGRTYLVTSSTKVSLYNSNDDKLQRSYSRFNNDAFSGKFRRDGKLILAGDKSGYVKVFELHTKSTLRTIQAHKDAVHGVDWTCDKLAILSVSDDHSVKRWDLGTEQLLWQSTSRHSDYVRAVSASPIIPSVFASGSYDHSVRLWDARQPEDQCIQLLTHGSPVECCMITASGALLLTAGGSEVKVWDLLGGTGKLLHTFNNHQKNVTGLSLNSSGSKMMSCGLDGFIKVYSMETLAVTHSIKCNGPLMSVALSPDDKKLVVGYVDGTLNIRNKTHPQIANASTSINDEMPSDRLQGRFYKGAGHAIDSNSVLLDKEHQTRLRPYESHLKKFNYQLALDTALRSRNPLIVVSVLEELCRRDGLTVALSGRDEQSLEPLLSFVSRHICNPRYARLLVQVTHSVLDLYSQVLGQSDAVDELFLKLRALVKKEVLFQRQAVKVMGSLDAIINTSTAAVSK